MPTTVNKPNLRVDPAKGPGPGLHWLTRVNSKNMKKNIWGFNILYEKIKKIIHVNIGYTCCKQLNLKDYFKIFFILHWKDTILFF
jgi:hypothetical protein